MGEVLITYEKYNMECIVWGVLGRRQLELGFNFQYCSRYEKYNIRRLHLGAFWAGDN